MHVLCNHETHVNLGLQRLHQPFLAGMNLGLPTGLQLQHHLQVCFSDFSRDMHALLVF
jgi:hypothetical protein